MPSCFYYINNILRKPDLFCQPSLLRYNGEAEYSTATGGFLSIAVIVIFVTLFFSMGLRTIRMEIITSNLETCS